MAHGRYPVSAYDLVRNHQTICSADALKAPTRRCLVPALSTAVCRPDPRCTVAASQISIAPADRAAQIPRFPSLAAFERMGLSIELSPKPVTTRETRSAISRAWPKKTSPAHTRHGLPRLRTQRL